MQYGRGYQQHGGEEAHFEKIDAEQAELDTEEREINALFDEMMRAEMLAGGTVTPAQMGSVGLPVRAVHWPTRGAGWASFTIRASRGAGRWAIEGGLCKQLGRARVGSHLGHA